MESPVKCEFCNKEFKNKKYCKQHVKLVHLKSLDKKPNFLCTVCGKIYLKKYNLQRHVNTVHFPEEHESFLCDKCTYKTIHKFCLIRHISNVHDKREEDLKINPVIRPYKCSLCCAEYKRLKHLTHHERKVHNFDPPTIQKEIKRKCPLCRFSTIGLNADSEIIKHFEAVHNISVPLEIFHFSSMEKFLCWKKYTEKATSSFFSKKYSSPKTWIFRCHRSGFYVRTGLNKRRLKIVGSCKIDGFCPAMMKIKLLPNSSLDVQYISKHVGHKSELKHIHLTKEEREQIATQLASNVPHNQILKNVKESLSNNVLSRFHLLKKKDIINIERSVKLNSEFEIHPFLSLPVSKECWVQDSEPGTPLENKKQELDKMYNEIESCLNTEEKVDVVINHLKQAISTLKAM